MSIIYTTAIKTARLNGARTAMVNGTLEIGTTGFATTIASFTIDGTAGSVTNDVWTITFSNATVAASNAGTAVEARLKDNGGTVQISGLTVGTSGTDIVFDNNVISSGQNVTLNSASITHA